MKTVIVPAPGKIEIRQVETPVINAYQALVKTEMVALCNATDSKLIAGKFPGVDTYPLALAPGAGPFWIRSAQPEARRILHGGAG